MHTRRFGRTGHQSSMAIFGAAAFWDVDQKSADQTLEIVLEAGVNHFDVAPSYGTAELRLGPWMPRIRDQIFLGCKTMERTRNGAWQEMHASLKKLQVDNFDLYQIHAVTNLTELDEATRKGGALEALIQARRAGLTRYIGITGHGVDASSIFIEALKRFDFDSVLFPVNYIQAADPDWRENTARLIKLCQEKDTGMMGIKSISRGPWGEHPKTHNTWYRPFTTPERIQTAINFALSTGITGICTAGDISLLPLVLAACQNFSTMNAEEQSALIETAGRFAPLFT